MKQNNHSHNDHPLIRTGPLVIASFLGALDLIKRPVVLKKYDSLLESK